MPEKETIERARRDKRHGKAPSTQAGEFVREEMEHIRAEARRTLRGIDDCAGASRSQRCTQTQRKIAFAFGEEGGANAGATLHDDVAREDEVVVERIAVVERARVSEENSGDHDRRTPREAARHEVIVAE